jgi:predicted metal-binding membrane protein
MAAKAIDVELRFRVTRMGLDAQVRSQAGPRPGDDNLIPRARAHARRHVGHPSFLGVCALVFAVSTVVTIVWCASMSAMGKMPMPGGWSMSMAWMRMPGQTWPGAAASFLAMWVVMMVAMMVPSLIPMLSRYREAIGRAGKMRLGPLTALVAIGYFFMYGVLGVVAFPVGVALAAIEMRQPALARVVPIAVGVVVLIAGAFQFTAWKARQLARCRETPGHDRKLPADAGTAWRHGVRLGIHCGRCCANLMLILLVIGIMDLRVMALVTAAIALERLAPDSERVARALGFVIVGAGVLLIARAVATRITQTDQGGRERVVRQEQTKTRREPWTRTRKAL